MIGLFDGKREPGEVAFKLMVVFVGAVVVVGCMLFALLYGLVFVESVWDREILGVLFCAPSAYAMEVSARVALFCIWMLLECEP